MRAFAQLLFKFSELQRNKNRILSQRLCNETEVLSSCSIYHHGVAGSKLSPVLKTLLAEKYKAIFFSQEREEKKNDKECSLMFFLVNYATVYAYECK